MAANERDLLQLYRETLIGNGAEGGFDPWALASFLGVSTSKINEDTRKYEGYRQQRAETAEDYKRKLLEDL